MMRFITPIFLIGVAITIFFVFTNPMYSDISTLRAQVSSYNEALDNSKSLENQRDILTAKYNAINPDDLARLQTLLPDNIDNIRLILEIEQIASPYNMTLTDIKYNADATTTSAAPATGAPVTPGSPGPVAGASAASSGGDYGAWDLEFSTTGTYANFLNFTQALESNLRIVDISSVAITTNTDATTTGPGTSATSSAGTYNYDFKITTYWLEN